MKYRVKRACGHLEDVNLYGPARDRERKLAWLRETVCRVCYREERTKAVEERFGISLPTLKGTPKQVAWAEDIRRDKLVKAAEQMAKFISSAPADTPAETLEETNRLLQTAFHRLAEQTSAKWWIENRHRAPRDMMREMHEQAS